MVVMKSGKSLQNRNTKEKNYGNASCVESVIVGEEGTWMYIAV